MEFLFPSLPGLDGSALISERCRHFYRDLQTVDHEDDNDIDEDPGVPCRKLIHLSHYFLIFCFPSTWQDKLPLCFQECHL